MLFLFNAKELDSLCFQERLDKEAMHYSFFRKTIL